VRDTLVIKVTHLRKVLDLEAKPRVLLCQSHGDVTRSASDVNDQRITQLLPWVPIDGVLYVIGSTSGNTSHCSREQFVQLVAIWFPESLKLRDLAANAHAVRALVRLGADAILIDGFGNRGACWEGYARIEIQPGLLRSNQR